MTFPSSSCSLQFEVVILILLGQQGEVAPIPCSFTPQLTDGKSPIRGTSRMAGDMVLRPGSSLKLS